MFPTAKARPVAILRVSVNGDRSVRTANPYDCREHERAKRLGNFQREPVCLHAYQHSYRNRPRRVPQKYSDVLHSMAAFLLVCSGNLQSQLL